ncbi:MAG: hypothetical protein K0S16_1958 [Moraxellaceae bacterium]|nr:hypothetical protein [Moraxellaceae bacterium]
MKTPALPPDEARRLDTLRSLGVLDTPPSEELDRITRLASRLFRTPMSAISLIDADRQWFKSSVGIAASEIERAVSFCGHTILQEEPLVVSDATTDPRFTGNPFVTDAPQIRAYAGQTICSRDGHALGTLCVIDHRPRHFTVEDLETLRDLAALVERQFHDLEVRREAALLRQGYEAASAQFESVFDQAGVGMATVGLDGRWLRVNERICAITGYNEAELLAGSFQDITYPDDLQPDLDNVNALLAGSIHDYTMEKRYRHREGHVVWVTLTVTLVRDDTGRPLYFISVIQDIDARKRLEQQLRQAHQELEARVEARTAELRERKARLRTVLETATDAFIATDEHGIISEWNAAAEQMFGWACDDVIGKSILDTIVPPGSRLNHLDSLAEFAHTGGSPAFKHILELTARRRDGSEFPMEISLNANRIGGKWLISSFVRDITARKAVEADLQAAKQHAEAALEETQAANARLRREEARAHLKLETATDAYVETDSQGLITEWNLAAERIFGWSRDEALGLSILDTIVPPASRDNHVERLRQFSGDGGQTRLVKHTLELSAVRRNGEEFPASRTSGSSAPSSATSRPARRLTPSCNPPWPRPRRPMPGCGARRHEPASSWKRPPMRMSKPIARASSPSGTSRPNASSAGRATKRSACPSSTPSCRQPHMATTSCGYASSPATAVRPGW